jgi:hypothetical protein
MGPLTAKANELSRACGSPFYGRNIGGNPGGEPSAASLTIECLRASASRRHITFVLAAAGLCLLLVVVVLGLAGAHRSGGPDGTSARSLRQILLLSGIGGMVTAALVLAGAGWAVARVPTRPSSPPTTAPTPTNQGG